MTYFDKMTKNMKFKKTGIDTINEMAGIFNERNRRIKENKNEKNHEI